MKHKALRGRAFVKDATQGIAEVVVSAYGNVDHDKDIVVKGSVAKQIAGEYGPNPKGLLDHDWSMRSAVAKTLRMWEEDDGTHIEAQYNLEKAIAREAFSDLSFYGADMEFSVGYEVKSSRRPTDDEKAMGAVQVITEWVINEWSHVMLGANSQTGLVAAKARTNTDAGAKAVEAKALVGSDEYRTERLTEALSEAFPSDWLWVRGTFADRVVYAREWCDGDDWEYGTFEVTYTDSADGYTFGQPVEVRTAEVVEVKSADMPVDDLDSTDATFVQAMIVHHTAAIEMATMYLSESDPETRSAQIADWATTIVAGQQAEIERAATWLPPEKSAAEVSRAKSRREFALLRATT